MFINGLTAVNGIELVNPFSPRKITHAFHDIDGTHSLIREWIPIMTLVTGYVAKYGLPKGDLEQAANEIMRHRKQKFQEAYRFAIESAGLSALTQMEWAIRSGVANGVISGLAVNHPVNVDIIRRIWLGQEIFTDFDEAKSYRDFLSEQTSKLFKIYEKILLQMCRNENLTDARKHQDKWRVSGSIEFLEFLHANGVVNYFVTGAVVDHDTNGTLSGTMYEEITALGYEVGEGKLVTNLYGSSWSKKLPKSEIMSHICTDKGINPNHVLIVGDGRSEIVAGVMMGAITISRLDVHAIRAREIHRQLQTNIIIPQYDLTVMRQIFAAV